MRAISRNRTRKEETKSVIADCRLRTADLLGDWCRQRVLQSAIQSAFRDPHSAKTRRVSRVLDSQTVQRGIRTAVPIVQEHVALILQIGDAHLGRPESARGKVAE